MRTSTSETDQFSTSSPSVSSARGAEWRQWDLHVHTPASIDQHYGDSHQEETWDKYIAALAALPDPIKAIGISDYFTLGGYRRILDAQVAGRLPNLTLILPVIEVRLAAFAGNAELQKLNFHVVFSEELSADTIEHFFLRKLDIKAVLDGNVEWTGDIGSEEGLIELGRAVIEATPKAKRTQESPLRVGFRSAAVDGELVRELLQQSVFRNQTLTAIGVGEWAQMRWEGAGALQKRDAINRADFVFTAASSPIKYQDKRADLRKQDVNERLIDASDAHYYATSSEPNRLGNSFTWIKADPTLRGLRRALQRFDDRVFVGSKPPKLEIVRENRTKYIDRIEIRKKKESSLEEPWFDVEMPINLDLVAVIGNQGSGKSALTDTLGLLGNAKCKHFSFLNPDKFCDRQKKATHFEARLHWVDGTVTQRTLSDSVDESHVERVRYVPQGFFDALTNEKSVKEGGGFYGEIKKTIFSHVAEDDRLGTNALDPLLELHTSEVDQALSSLREELRDLNRRIIAVESASSTESVLAAEMQVRQKEAEIAALSASPPAKIEQPSGSDETTKAIAESREQEASLTDKLGELESAKMREKRKLLTVEKALQGLDNAYSSAVTAINRVQRELAEESISVDLNRVLRVAFDKSSLQSIKQTFEDAIAAATTQLNPNVEGTVANQLLSKREARSSLEQGLQEAARRYQAYLTDMLEWEDRLAEMEGTGTSTAPNSLRALKAHFEDLKTAKPRELDKLLSARRNKVKEIHSKISSISSFYDKVTGPVRAHIQNEQLTREKYRLEFNVALNESGFADSLFALISQSTGPFSGLQAGRERLQLMIAQPDFAVAEEAIEFAEEILRLLDWDSRTEPRVYVGAGSLLKKGHTIEQLYDLIFSLAYISPLFTMALNGKPLRLLTPGERGILLLVFYLVVDIGEEPLIIDQPEGNLNNQSIFEHLVPVFLAAKRRRQIVIVTHNPNLAVVCDAEQVIHCQHDEAGHLITYESGALENPKFNQLSLDLLEGTSDAFESRRVTYQQ